jgi:hypothetical protein
VLVKQTEFAKGGRLLSHAFDARELGLFAPCTPRRLSVARLGSQGLKKARYVGTCVIQGFVEAGGLKVA